MVSGLIEKLRSRLEHPLPGEVAHGVMSPKLPSGSKVKFTNKANPRKGAVLLLLYEHEDSFHFPLIQRPVYEGVHSGQIAFPGGRWEEQDNDLYQTAMREANEEIGIDPDRVKILGTLSEFFVGASNHLILPVVGFTEKIPVYRRDPVEVDEIIEAPLDELLDKSRLKETEIVTNHGYRLSSPYFDIRGKIVWGATAMMLNEFVTIVRDL